MDLLFVVPQNGEASDPGRLERVLGFKLGAAQLPRSKQDRSGGKGNYERSIRLLLKRVEELVQ